MRCKIKTYQSLQDSKEISFTICQSFLLCCLLFFLSTVLKRATSLNHQPHGHQCSTFRSHFKQVKSILDFRKKLENNRPLSPLIRHSKTTPTNAREKKHCILHGFGPFVRGDRPKNLTSRNINFAKSRSRYSVV